MKASVAGIFVGIGIAVGVASTDALAACSSMVTAPTEAEARQKVFVTFARSCGYIPTSITCWYNNFPNTQNVWSCSAFG
ncbi:hypothetical protein GCM10009092_00370 [Bowmanella denitrificans]|uniref:Uncharacterized protein n=1 Tax=Bowmanella denitrificans TaxID=366582 RepID=A0ABN0WK68_9ALTE